jgi:phage shock protein PspC (stress-responsive transcriptional regulator)
VDPRHGKLLHVNYEGETKVEASSQSHPSVNSNSLEGARAWFAEKGLARSREDRMVAGVAGAFARRFGVNPFAMRVASVATMIIFTPFVYIGLWILMPKAD